MQQLQLLSVLSRTVLEEITSIKVEMWSQWERVTANMLMLRTNAIKLLKRAEFTFSDLFPGVEADGAIVDLEFETYSKYYQRKDFPQQFLRNPKTTLEQQGAGLFKPGTVWLNGPRGPGLDLWAVYKNKKDPHSSNKNYTITFVQCKFTSSDLVLKTKDIINTYKDPEKMWKNLEKEINGNPLQGSNIRLTDYEIVLVIVSNRGKLEDHVSVPLPNHQLPKNSCLPP